MRQRKTLGLMGAVAGVAAAVTAQMAGLAAVGDLLAGIVLGALSTLGLMSMTGATRAGQPPVWRVIVLGLHLLKYPLILALLYLMLVTLHRSALLVMGGYTLALIGFLLIVTRNASAPTAKPES